MIGSARFEGATTGGPSGPVRAREGRARSQPLATGPSGPGLDGHPPTKLSWLGVKMDWARLQGDQARNLAPNLLKLTAMERRSQRCHPSTVRGMRGGGPRDVRSGAPPPPPHTDRGVEFGE